jgi:hypothetical protein
VLTDFGLALLTETGTRGQAFGSPHYMAPEQAMSSAAARPASDLYSLGVVAFELLTGHRPFEASSAIDVALAHVQQPPPAPRGLRPDLGPRTEAVLLRALAKTPDERFPSGAALAQALEQALTADGLLTVPPETMGSLAVPAAPRQPPPVAPDATPLHVPPPGPTASAARPAGAGPLGGRLGCAAGLLLVLAACGAWGLWSAAGLGTGAPGDDGLFPTLAVMTDTAAPSPTSEPTATPEPTHTPEPTATVEPTPTLPAPTETPAPVARVHALLVAKRANEALFFANQGELPLRLEPFWLRGDNADDVVQGARWQVEALAPGQCVVIVRERRGADQDELRDALRFPPNLECEVVGRLLTVTRPNRLWSPELELFYADAPLGRCPAEEAACRFEFAEPG